MGRQIELLCILYTWVDKLTCVYYIHGLTNSIVLYIIYMGRQIQLLCILYTWVDKFNCSVYYIHG